MWKDFIYNIKMNIFKIVLLTDIFIGVIINIVVKNKWGDIVGTITIWI